MPQMWKAHSVTCEQKEQFVYQSDAVCECEMEETKKKMWFCRDVKFSHSK